MSLSQIDLTVNNVAPAFDESAADTVVICTKLVSQLTSIKKEMDEKVKEYQKLVRSIRFWKRATWFVSIIVSVLGAGILYCSSAYVNKVEQRYDSYKENVENYLENYEKRFSDLKDYCMAVQCKSNE